MTEDRAARLHLRPKYLLLVAVPALVLGAGVLLIGTLGHPSENGLELTALSGAAEAAGRVKVLATSLLLAFLGIGSMICFWLAFRRFDRPSRKALALAYGGLVVVGIGCLASGQPEEAHRFIGENFVCRSFTAMQTFPPEPVVQPPPAAPAAASPAGEASVAASTLPAAEPRPAAGAAAPAPTQASGAEPEPKADQPPPPPARSSAAKETASLLSENAGCTAPNWHRMRWLNNVQRVLLALVTPALVLGMIASLATGTSSLGEQAERLNTYLYLSAAVLVAGLLFLSALLRWPGFAVPPKDPSAIYDAHVAAITLYWGVVYSLFTAATYVPVAYLLKSGEAGKAAPQAGAAEGQPDPLWTPVHMLKQATVIFAPAIAGLLSGVMEI